ncbi:radical SAM/SPASM domain-containing protein [Clostridioides difficile]
MKAKLDVKYEKKRIQLHEKIPLDTPFTVHVIPSTTCNFKCSYCVHSLNKKDLEMKKFTPSIMHWDTFTTVIEQLKYFDSKIKRILLTGDGEPMCNVDLPRMIRYIKEANIAEKVDFTTNGSLLTRQNIIELIEAGLDCIDISIQGLSSEKYEQICGTKLDFDEFVKNIKFLYDNRKNCKVIIKIIDIALDEGEEKRFFELFGDICDVICIEKVRPVFEGVNYSNMIKDNEVMDRYGNLHNRRIVCQRVFYTLAIWPNGDVYPCCVFDHRAMIDNIKNVTLKEIWNGEKRKSFLLMQLNKKRMNNNICKKCIVPDEIYTPEDDLDEYAEELKGRF